MVSFKLYLSHCVTGLHVRAHSHTVIAIVIAIAMLPFKL